VPGKRPAAKAPPQITPALLSKLFTRFTADRDALMAAVERCELRLAELSQRLAASTGGAPALDDGKADEALETAREALAMAREAMRAVEYSRDE
jgi:hypothetical protein